MREKALIKTWSNTASLSFPRAWLRPTLGLLISAGAILWLATTLDFRQVLLVFQTINYRWVGIGCLTVCLTLWARVRRWQLLLDSGQVRRSSVLQALVLGQLLNLILPLRLGDLGRAYLITKSGYTSQLQALGTISLEKLWDMAMLLTLMIGLSWGSPLPPWAALSLKGTLIGAISLLLLLFTLLWLQPYLTIELRRLQPGRLFEHFTQGLAGLSQPRLILGAGSWSALVWLLGGLTNLSLLKAFGLPGSPWLAFLLLLVLMLGIAIPAAPVNLGVFEGLCLVTLTPFGVEPHTALAYGVTLHLVTLLPPLGIGVWSLSGLDQISLWRLA